ncbi:MAG: NUDIX hydrolase [Candidatus Aenigmatarchaeota archaeon]
MFRLVERPVSVAISALVDGDKILLINRERGDYTGLWGLPGGKIEGDEHIHQAAEREIQEETGIDADFEEHLAIVSEHLKEDGEILKHLILHICELEPLHTDFSTTEEGDLKWFDLEEIESQRENLIPSDYFFIERFVKGDEDGCFKCGILKDGSEHTLEKFEKV